MLPCALPIAVTVERMETTRRTLLRAGTAVGVATTLTGLASSTADARSGAARLRQDPFRLGIASGDPWPDGFVLWTRLAMEPLAEDGRGGMPKAGIAVLWEVATDPQMRRIVRRGSVVARPEHAHAVHITLRDLRPGREYWYRFSAGRWLSQIGRTLTAPAPWTMPESLAMSFASCSQYEHGFFTAYRRLAEDEPDLVLHLGDYQYEYTADTYVAPGGNVRDHAGPETTDLATYRQRHAQYKTDPDLQVAHAVAPWLVVWDDHEVDNNWADEIPERPEEGFLARRADAFRAFYENMPLRRSSAPNGIDLKLFRSVAWGRLVNFHMLDTRQYRDDQGCGDGYDTDCPEAVDPSRSIMGDDQERWLINRFRRSESRWDVIGQQVFFSQRDADPGPNKTVSMDAWDGYAPSRERITRGWIDAGVRNPVVLTGDVHSHWASDIRVDFQDTTSRVVGAELVCSSITSGGDGSDSLSGSHPWLAGGQNPHLRLQNSLRGYVRTTITREEMTADFRVLPYVSRPGAEAFTRASFAIYDREPGLDLTYDNQPEDTQSRRFTRRMGDATIRLETERP